MGQGVLSWGGNWTSKVLHVVPLKSVLINHSTSPLQLFLVSFLLFTDVELWIKVLLAENRTMGHPYWTFIINE
jgi:hypothetical protein